MALAANVLNAIGGEPSINRPGFIPRYPMRLPIVDDDVVVNLGPFSRSAVASFLAIERPSAPKGQPLGCHRINEFRTIGQFYEAIELALCELSTKNDIFCGDPRRQITPEHYYGAGGKVTPVTDLETALVCLKEIVGQGEGVHHTIWDGDEEFSAESAEVAHFFRFKEILAGQKYRLGDKLKSEPSGVCFSVNWDGVYPMEENPRVAGYSVGSDLWHKAQKFNRLYMALLDELHAATNGEPDRLGLSVPIMFELKYEAVELMRIPIAPDKTAGPTFEYCTS